MQSVKQNLLAAFRYLLKPLVRLALKNEVVFADFNEALRRAYVDVATKQMSASNTNVTVEGISLITHIESQQIRDILQAGDDANYGRTAHEVSPLAVILSAWHTDPKYTGPYGVLRDLEFPTTALTAHRSDTFAALVNACFPGIAPQVILDELVRIGAVQDVGNGFYRAIKRSYVPDPLSIQSILNLARVVHNLCETLEVNLRPSSVGGKGLIERSIYTAHGISKKHHEEFDKFIRARGQVFADDVDNWITDRDVEGIKDGINIGVGFYHYIVNEDDEVALTKELSN
jgi:hypothetical protein